MNHAGRPVGASLLAAAALVLVFAAPALAECGSPPPARSAAVPVKFAFTATVTEVSDHVDPPMADSAPFDWHVELAVRRAYRGGLPERLTLDGWVVGCSFLRPEGLHAGDQIFMTLDRLDLEKNPSLFGQMLLWRRTGDGWTFADDALQGGKDAAFWPVAARRANTTREILMLIDVSPAPDTSTSPGVPPGSAPIAPLVAAFAVTLAITLRHAARRRA